MTLPIEPFDPKKLLRCPGGCGLVADFTEILKCNRCGKILCTVCARRFRKRPHCKPCIQDLQKEVTS